MKIEELQKVIQELPLNRRMKPNLLGQKKDNVDKLYDLIKKGKVSSEQDAIQQIYPHNRYPARSLWKIKEKLIERIGVSLLFFVPKDYFSTYEWAKIKTYKLYTLFKIFSFTPFRPLAKYYGEKVFNLARKYHISDICLSSAIELGHLYGLVLRDEENFDFYNQMIDKYFEILKAEIELEKILISFLPKLKTKKWASPSEKEETRKIITIVKNIYKKGMSHHVEIYSSFILSNCYLWLKEYDNATDICNKCLKNLKTFDFEVHKTLLFVFESKKIPGLLINGNYFEAKKSIKECLNIIPEGGHNFLAAKQLELLILFYIKEYNQVYDKLEQLYKDTHPNSETFETYKAYASILTNRHLRLARFINQVPIFSKDKKGMNINILIIEVLDYLRKKVYSKIIDRTAALQRYCYRYLVDDISTYRSYQFFQIILCLEKGAFCKKEVDPLVAKHLQALKDHPLSEAQQDYELEIVPYEHLWEFMRNYLR
jgi:tetratricopeptide (TPR) repeat protein